MKQISLAVLAFVRVSSAIRINEKSAFIDGNFDSDNTYMQDIVMHEKKEIDDARQFKLNKAQSIAQKVMRPQNNEKVGMKQDMRMESDPISGSLGHLEKPPKLSEEGKLEADLASRQPFQYSLDPNVGPTTLKSIEWAEKQTGFKMPEPPMKNSTELKAAGSEKFEFDDDMDVNNTMKSIEWAEDQYGYNGHHYNYSYGGYGGGQFDSSNNYTGWEANSVDPKKRDWWNYLVRDQFDGMRSVGRELNTAELDKAGVSPGDIHDRMTEYERMLGAKAAAGKLSDEDREYARNLKAHLFGIHDGSYNWDWQHGNGKDKEQEVPTPKRGKFQLTPEEMKAAREDVEELKDQKYKKRTAGQNKKEEESEEVPPELKAPAAAASEELPPELNPNAAAQKGEKKEAAPESAAMQKNKPAIEEETFSVAQQKSNMDKATRNTINIEGIDIKVEDMNDMQMNSDDLIQLGEAQTQKSNSNQEELYELMSQN